MAAFYFCRSMVTRTHTHPFAYTIHKITVTVAAFELRTLSALLMQVYDVSKQHVNKTKQTKPKCAPGLKNK